MLWHTHLYLDVIVQRQCVVVSLSNYSSSFHVPVLQTLCQEDLVVKSLKIIILLTSLLSAYSSISLSIHVLSVYIRYLSQKQMMNHTITKLHNISFEHILFLVNTIQPLLCINPCVHAYWGLSQELLRQEGGKLSLPIEQWTAPVAICTLPTYTSTMSNGRCYFPCIICSYIIYFHNNHTYLIEKPVRVFTIAVQMLLEKATKAMFAL